MKAYHVTQTKNIPSIKKKGLLVDTRKNVRISKKGTSYIMADKMHAGFFASEMAWKGEQPVSIIHVKVDKRKLVPDRNTGAIGGAWYEYPENIPKQDIIKVEPWDKQSKRKHMKLMEKKFK